MRRTFLCRVLVTLLVCAACDALAETPDELKEGKYRFLLDLGENLELLSQMSRQDKERFKMLDMSARQELGLVTQKNLSSLKNKTHSSLSEPDRFLLAKIFIRNNDCKEGLKYLKGKGLALGSHTQAERAYYRAMCFMDFGHHNFAAQALSGALEGEWAANAYYNLATDYLNTKRNPKKALISLRVARDINAGGRESASELNNRVNLTAGSIYLDNGNFELANDFFDQIPLDSRYVTQGLYMAGLAKAERRDNRGAIQVWQANQKHALVEPGVIESLLALPMIQRKTGYENQALESYLKASTLIDAEIETLREFKAQIKKHGVEKVLFEDPDNNGLEWYLDRTKAKNTSRIAYLTYLANQKNMRELLNDYFQLKEFHTRLTQAQSRLANHKLSMTAQQRKISKALKNKKHKTLLQRANKLQPTIKDLGRQLAPAISKELNSKVRSLVQDIQSIDKRLSDRSKTIKSQLKKHASLTTKLKQKRSKLNALIKAYEKKLTKASLDSLQLLNVDLVKHYEEAELGLISILDSVARLRTKRTNLLDGRYQ